MDQAHQTRMLYLEYHKDPFWAHFFSNLYWWSDTPTHFRWQSLCSLCRWPPAVSYHQGTGGLSTSTGWYFKHWQVVQQNHLTFNSAKYRYMVISRKRRPTHPGVLYLGDTPLELVECFKYLGVILAGDLSSSQHINSVCSKARKVLGLLHRRFYKYASKDTFVQLCLSLVRPHLEYASPVWNPYMQKP